MNHLHHLRSLLFILPLFVGKSFAVEPHWVPESESPETRILQFGDTLDITAPKGLSLWWDEPLTAPCTISYRACVVMADGSCDRLSDLNCFWMATTPEGLSPLQTLSTRKGRFAEHYRLQCYYLGYGGNHNTTTRFRRYDGDSLAVADSTHRPPILKEYTDPAHLLRPNHWYAIRIDVHTNGHIQYFIDDELLVDYIDPTPLLHGFFAFRTTWSHTKLIGLKIIHHNT